MSKMEHPGDWIMREGELSQWCSSLAYRLLTLADQCADRKGMTLREAQIVMGIENHIHTLQQGV